MWGDPAVRENQLFEDIIESGEDTGPYLRKVITRRIEQLTYNPKYGDDRVCRCGHPYYRHFDPYEGQAPVGCKYCECYTFEEETQQSSGGANGNSAVGDRTAASDDVGSQADLEP